jgi:hypothetical protein
MQAVNIRMYGSNIANVRVILRSESSGALSGNTLRGGPAFRSLGWSAISKWAQLSCSTTGGSLPLRFSRFWLSEGSAAGCTSAGRSRCRPGSD